MNFSEQCFRIFEQATEAYHVTDNVDATVHNPYAVKSIEFYLYLKNWIDAVQWHLEDIIRNPEIDPVDALFHLFYSLFQLFQICGIRVGERLIEVFDQGIQIGDV